MILLIVFIIIGLIFGILFQKNRSVSFIASNSLHVVVYLLLFVMGYKLAINKEVFLKQKNLFFQAMISSVILLIFFVLYSFFKIILIKIIRIIKINQKRIQDKTCDFTNNFLLNKFMPKNKVLLNESNVEYKNGIKGEIIAVLINLGFIILGFIIYFLIGISNNLSTFVEKNIDKISEIILFVLLFFVGLDLGRNIDLLKKQRLKISNLLLPIESIIITVLSSFVFSLIFSKNLIESMIIYGGLGWYSLSSVLLSVNGLTILAIYSFIHNVFRELIAILSSPILAKFDPYLPILIGGATSMDVMLPFVQKYSGQLYTLASFYSGAFCSISVSFIIKSLIGFLI